MSKKSRLYHGLSVIRRMSFRIYCFLLMSWVRYQVIAVQNISIIQKHKLILFVIKNNSWVDAAIVTHVCKEYGLPPPIWNRHAVEFNALMLEALEHSTSMIHQLDQWLETKQQTELQIVPVGVYIGNTSQDSPSGWSSIFEEGWQVSGFVRKALQVIFLGKKTRVQFSECLVPDTSTDNKLSSPFNSEKLINLIKTKLHNQQVSMIGPDLSHRRTLVDAVLNSEKVKEAIAVEKKSHPAMASKVDKKALSYANEITSDFSYPVIHFLSALLKWFWHRIYDGISVHHLDRLQSSIEGKEVVYVPCHRSHIDYLLLSYLLFHNGLMPPHIAAGINLNMPIVGTLLRGGGAFFMRRTFKENLLYKSIFSEYMHLLFQKGFPMEYFIEGGRSRTGRLLEPKTGMIQMTLSSWYQGHTKPLIMVPVYIGYSKVLESSTYLGELRGSVKKKESIWDLLKIISILKQEFGRVDVNFGPPIDVDQFMRHLKPTQGKSNSVSEHLSHQFPEVKWASGQLAQKVAESINDALVVNPINRIAMLLLSTPRQAIEQSFLMMSLQWLTNIEQQAPYNINTIYAQHSPEEQLAYAKKLQILQTHEDDFGCIEYAGAENAIMLTYYRNNVMHAYALPCMIAACMINQQKLSNKELNIIVGTIFPFVKNELFISIPPEELESAIDRVIKSFCDLGLVELDGENYRIKPKESLAFRFLSLLSNNLTQMLQRFYLTIATLAHYGPDRLTKDDLAQSSVNIAKRINKLHGINAPEFSDRTLFMRFIKCLTQNGWIVISTEDLIQYDAQVVRRTERLAEMFIAPELALSVKQGLAASVNHLTNTV